MTTTKTFTVEYKFTDYRFTPKGEAFNITKENIPFDKLYTCISTHYLIFDRNCSVWLSYDLKTHTFIYDSKCYV